jgi:hypothetical protein
LTLCFKGGRDYLHGTDVYDAIAALADAKCSGGVSRVRLSIHRFFRHQPDLVWTWGELPRDRPAGAVVDFSVAGDRVMSGWFVEQDRPVDCRVPYDEDAIAACCEIEGDVITARAEPPGRPIEALVSMTKRLHLSRHPVAGTARWIFTRLDLRRLLCGQDPRGFRLRLVDNLHGRITRTEVLVGGEALGSIYFSLVGR